MATEKVSLTLDRDLLAEARTVAGSRGLSRYVDRALRRELQRERLGRFLAQVAREEGPVAEVVMERVRREWPAGDDRKRRSRSA